MVGENVLHSRESLKFLPFVFSRISSQENCTFLVFFFVFISMLIVVVVVEVALVVGGPRRSPFPEGTGRSRGEYPPRRVPLPDSSPDLFALLVFML